MNWVNWDKIIFLWKFFNSNNDKLNLLGIFANLLVFLNRVHRIFDYVLFSFYAFLTVYLHHVGIYNPTPSSDYL
jgi:hypothetical protein